MSPLRSSAGPRRSAGRRRAPRGRCRRGSSSRGRAGRRGGRGRAHPPPLRRLERDRELLLDALLADELVQRASRASRIELVNGRAPRSSEREHGAVVTRSLRRATPPSKRLADALGRREVGVGLGEPLLGLGRGIAELDERVAGDDVPVAGPRCGASSTAASGAMRSFSSSTTRCAVFLPMPGNRLEERGVLADDRAAELGRRVAGDDRQRHLRAHAGDGEELLEELPLVGVGEAVELQRPRGRAGASRRRPRRRPRTCARRMGSRAAGSRLRPPRGRARLRPATPACRGGARSSSGSREREQGGASAWQIATASASAAWCGRGTSARPSTALTMRCTWIFSARP